MPYVLQAAKVAQKSEKSHRMTFNTVPFLHPFYPMTVLFRLKATILSFKKLIFAITQQA